MKSRSNLKKMVWNNNNNRLSWSCSSPILKRHKKMMDDDLIGKVRTTTISDLPEEVLTEVLVRLSIKDILACVCVQKSWHSLIKTPMFITLHSNYKSSNPNNKYLLFGNSTKDYDWNTYYEIRVDDIQCEKYLALKYPPHLSPPHLSKQCPLLVSNGLICLFAMKATQIIPDIYLWNPLIQTYITLPHYSPRSPPPPHSQAYLPPRAPYCWKAVAFGFVPQINDYRVVVMIKYTWSRITWPIITCVYSLNTNSWKEATHTRNMYTNIQLYSCSSESIFVNGIAIWVGKNSKGKRILVCFDTKTDMLREILSPQSSDPVICAVDQSIVYFAEKGSEKLVMWVLKGDPMGEFSWEKKMVIVIPKGGRQQVMGVRNNGEPILLKGHDMISYNLDSHKSYRLVKSWYGWTPRPSSTNRRGGMSPFKIKPFRESLSLLDHIDSTKYFDRKPC